MTFRICMVLLAGLFAGCAGRGAPYNRAFVSVGIEDGAGHRLGPPTTTGEANIPEGVMLEDGISEDEAVALALWNNADFQELLTELGVARADFIKAGLISNPVLSFLFPRGPRQFEAALTFSLDVIWLRPRRLAIAELRSGNVGQRLVQDGLDLVRDVRTAYADLALARDRARLGGETAELLGRIAELSEKRLLAGDISEFEVTAARIDAVQARGETASLDRDVDLAREGLKLLLGLGFAESEIVFADAPRAPLAAPELGPLVQSALAARPDLRAAELATEAAAKQIGLARWEYLKLDAFLDGDKFDSLDSNRFEVGPGFKAPIPIFNRNQDGVARAQAEFERSVRHQLAVRHQIAFEVNTAHTRYLQAQEKLELLRTQVLAMTKQAVAQAEKAYGNGNISFLLVLETTRRHQDARHQEVEAAANLRRARAELERSLGRRLEN